MSENLRTQPMFPPEEVGKAAHFKANNFIGLWVANEMRRIAHIRKMKANLGTQAVTQKQW